jgi:enamine deaminase RidA (YjgF/YER057c/UK114 family)
LPLDPHTGDLVEGGFEAQARVALRNLTAVIRAAGGSVEHTVRVGVYLRDIANAPSLMTPYSEVFSAPYPARTTIEAKVPLGAEIEVDAVVSLDR